MRTDDDLRRAEELFASGDDDALLDYATAFWARHGPTGAGASEVARFARIAAYRSRPAQDQTWQARAIEAACLTGSWRSLALSLRQYADRLTVSGELRAADSLLRVMEVLTNLDQQGEPPKDLVDGILAERRAFLLTQSQDWAGAAKWLSKALHLCPTGERRELKVKGSLARAKWLAGGPDHEAVREFQALVNASADCPDVREWAEANLQAAQAGDRSRSIPFDLL